MGPELYRVIKSENERFGFATNKTVILSSLPPDNARSCSGAFQTACDHRLKAGPLQRDPPASGFQRGWGARPGNFPAGLFPENFQPDFPKKILAGFVEKISGKF